MTPDIVAEHIRQFIHTDQLRERVDIAVQVLRDYDFDTIAFRGISGALIAPPVALRMNKQMIVVRKPEDSTHSLLKVEGNKAARKYVILDDFSCSGATRRAIVEAVTTFAPDACFLGLLGVRDITQINIEYYASRCKRYPLE